MAATLPAVAPGVAALPNTPRGQFAQGVALRTGLNPWVIYAWTLAENNDQSVKRRPYNYLNFKSYNGRGAVHIGSSVNCDRATDGGCFPGFASVDAAIANTAYIIQHDFPTIRQTANKGGTAQVNAIVNSHWGTSAGSLGAALRSVVEMIRHAGGDPNASINIPREHGGSAIGSVVGGAISGASAAGGAIASTAEGAAGIITAPLTIAESLAKLVGFLLNPNNWLRIGQIVAGAVCVLAGAFILARGAGAPMPSVPVASNVADAAEVAAVA